MKEDRHSPEENTAQAFSIQTRADKCVGCNRCIRVCPIETANITYQDDAGDIKVKIDPVQCILCGACVEVCEHEARYVHDDLTRFLADLAAGEAISVMAAPSVRTNIPGWQQLFTWLRGLGVQHIYDVSLGADICTWAHLRWLEENPRPLITQPCPVVVSYCERHRPELLGRLSPVHSPMACTALYMRSHGVSGRIASISPCIAKTEEHHATGLVDYNITFAGLLAYLEEAGIALPAEESGFDHPDAGPGALFPLPGGLKENLTFFMGDRLRVEETSGPGVFRYLDQYAVTEAEYLPAVFDVLNCADGCLIGTGCRKDQNIFRLSKEMDTLRTRAGRNMQQSLSRLDAYDAQLNLADYCRSYTPRPGPSAEVPEAAIEAAFARMGKDTYTKKHFNCGACGSDSCRSMARKIALGVNMPMNCVIAARDDAKHQREQNAEYLSLVRNIGDNLFDTDDASYVSEINKALRVLSETVRCSAAAIWRKGSTKYERVAGWYGTDPSRIRILGEWPDELIARLEGGERISINAQQDMPGLFPKCATTLFIVPVHIRGRFWGFVDAISEEVRSFNKEEASVLEAAGILLISGILERELNTSLVASREEALSATRAKSDFLSRMSHEIRTPMNAIIGMTQMGKTTRELERKDYCLEKISGASTHLLGVINDILDMSKIEADKFELSYVPFKFEKMLQNVANVIGFRVEEKEQVFTVHIDSRIPATVEGDDQRLAQIITNLLSNAVKFTPEGGSIRLAATLEDETDGLCRLRVEVSDTGIGVNEADRERLFQSFEQAESGTSRRYGGTGLGLAISRRIVEMMGGSIWVETAPGGGASFVFTILARRVQQDNAPAPLLRRENLRLLAVDDAPEVREFFTETAARFGLHCDVAESAESALGLMTREPEYDVCFVDYVMPGMDGIELARALWRQQETAPYIVLVSGMDRSELEAPAREAGVSRFLAKPLFPSDIQDCINESLGATGVVLHEDTPPDDTGCFTGCRILFAEDIDINREIAETLLEPTALAIDHAENGRVALEKMAADPTGYDLILMDIQMPEMDGYAATEAIRQLEHPRAQEIPIIAMTANVFREDVEKCLASGMNGHVGKPIDYEDMMAELRKYLTVAGG